MLSSKQSMLLSMLWVVLHKLAESPIAKNKTYDVGFSSVCCEYVLLPLINKESVLCLWKDSIKSGEKSEQRYREKVGTDKEMSSSCQKRKMPAANC